MMDYKKMLLEMIEKIENQEILVKIYYFAKVHADKEKGARK